MKLIPYIFLIISISGIIGGAAVITIAEFGDSIEQPCWNESYSLNANSNGCTNNTEGAQSNRGVGDLNLSDEYYVKLQSVAGLNDVSGQLPTVAIIAVMVIVISVIAGVFVYLKYFG